MTASVLDGWVREDFTAAGITHGWYRRGEGPAVIVIHELPGITPRVTAFADEVVAAGMTVAMPDLVGTAGEAPSRGALARSLARVCISREFSTWATGQTSPVVAWLRALGRSLHLECGGPGVGAVGMCFSGGFALAMMVDDTMGGSQPLLMRLSQPA